MELPERQVTVHRFAQLWREGDRAEFEVECSSGTYVRALARDLGAALGVGGHLTALRRTRVGPFDLSVAHTLDDLAGLADPVVLPLAEAIRTAMPVRELDEREAVALSFGKSIAAGGLDGTYGVLLEGRAIALVRDDGPAARPVIVFAAAG